MTMIAEAANVALIVVAAVAFPITVWRSGRIERDRRARFLAVK